MSPHTRTAAALGMTLVLWLPVAFSVLNGQTDIAIAGLYFLAALAFSWVGTGIIAHIMQGYVDAANNVQKAKLHIEYLERQAAARERRRKEDKEDADAASDHDDLPPMV